MSSTHRRVCWFDLDTGSLAESVQDLVVPLSGQALIPRLVGGRSDGADLRVSRDADGAEELATDLRFLDRGAGEGLLDVLVPLAEPGVPLRLHVWTGLTGSEVRPAVGAPNGAGAVRAGYQMIAPLSADPGAPFENLGSGGAVLRIAANGPSRPAPLNRQAASFVGGSNEAYYIVTLNPGQTVTLEAWAMPDSLATGGTVIGIGNNVEHAQKASIRLVPDGAGGARWHATARDAAENQVWLGGSGESAAAAGVWQHLMLTIDNDGARFFVNGALTGEALLGPFLTFTLGALVRIGRLWADTGPDSYFEGGISEARIYEGTRSNAWVGAYYRGLSGALLSGPEARVRPGRTLSVPARRSGIAVRAG
jgi:hypothetical protein